MTGRRSILRGALGALMGTQLPNQPSLASIPPSSINLGLDAELGGHAKPFSASQPHIPDSVWNLREQIDNERDRADRELFDAGARARLNVDCLRSVKPPARMYYAQQEYERLLAVRRTVMAQWADQLEKVTAPLGITNPYANRTRKRPRTANYW